jgi:hypothetical protein
MTILAGQAASCEDWLTTMAFYTAVHLVESRLATYHQHSPDHHSREQWMARCSDFRGVIYNNYSELKRQSERARYGCVTISHTEWASQILPALQSLEVAIAALP